MATGPLQTSGDTYAQVAQMIATMGGAAPTSAGKSDWLKALNTALASYITPDGSVIVAPATAAAETIPRNIAAQSVSIATVSGTLQLAAIFLPANTLVTNVNFVTGTTASVGVSHNWAVLADLNRKVLAVSADNTTTDLVASTVQTYAMGTPFTTTYSGLYYIGFVIAVATTTPTMIGYTAAASTLNNIAPKTAGASNTGATTPVALAATLTAITVSASTLYGYIT